MRSRHTVMLVCLVAALLAAGSTMLEAGAATAPAGQPGDWAQFRFDPAHGGVNTAETAITTTAARSLAVRWSVSTGDTIFSSPAIVAGNVYVGTLGGRLEAFDAATGALRWSAPNDALPGDTVWSSPAVAGGVVYAAVNRPDGVVFAFDAQTGKTIWTASPTRAPSSRRRRWPEASSTWG